MAFPFKLIVDTMKLKEGRLQSKEAKEKADLRTHMLTNSLGLIVQ
jgi:hypothetical protein